MTCLEFSNAFDVLLASYKYKPEFENSYSLEDLVFDEYEKSVFLTKAQEEILLSYYSGKNNDTYEQTEEIRRYFSSLNKELALPSIKTESFLEFEKLIFSTPKDLWFITFEAITSPNKLVVPIRREELYKTLQNPFKNNLYCFRLEGSQAEVKDTLILIGKNIQKCVYTINYIAKPSPIILTDLEEDLTIDGMSTKTECIVHSGLHNKILDRAVALAIASRTIIQK